MLYLENEAMFNFSQKSLMPFFHLILQFMGVLLGNKVNGLTALFFIFPCDCSSIFREYNGQANLKLAYYQ